MPSKNAKAWKALKTALESYPALPFVAYGGQSFDPPDNAPYLIVDDVRFEPVRNKYGSNSKNWNTGNLSINTMTPIEWTDVQHAEYIGDISDYFAQDMAMTYDDVTLRVSQQPAIANAGYRDGDMWRQTLLVNWEGWL